MDADEDQEVKPSKLKAILPKEKPEPPKKHDLEYFKNDSPAVRLFAQFQSKLPFIVGPVCGAAGFILGKLV
jgi:hypothetical protein